MNISLAELSCRIKQTPQNCGKKKKRGTVTVEELKQIAGAGAKYEERFVSTDGSNINNINA
jgi:hypothetical protein